MMYLKYSFELYMNETKILELCFNMFTSTYIHMYIVHDNVWYMSDAPGIMRVPSIKFWKGASIRIDEEYHIMDQNHGKMDSNVDFPR